MYFYLVDPTSDKSTVINLIYYLKFEKKNFKYSTKLKIDPADWSFENRYPKLRKGGAGKKIRKIVLKLEQYRNLLEETIEDFNLKDQPLLKSQIKEIFDAAFRGYEKVGADDFEAAGPTNKTLVASIDYFIKVKTKSKGVSGGWINKYKNLRNKIELFDVFKNTTTSFNDLNTNWLDEYVGFLRALPTHLKEKPYQKKVRDLPGVKKWPKAAYNDNTLNRHVIFLFTFLNWSKGNLHDLNLDKLKNPVKDFETDDVHLTSDELQKLETVKLKRPAQIRARDLFLIGVYSGQRFSDYSVFEAADVVGDMIIKRSEKTEKDSFIPLHDKLRFLLEKYDWQLPKISSQKFNPHIRKILRKAEVTARVKKTNYTGNKKEVSYYDKCDIVSSHTARRTFITLAAERGMPDHVIMKITGIKDPKTLVKYKKTNQKTVSEFMNKMWL
tara:strand:+ start:17311 stop:18630 length:1320 start_codon:yes stop_codon:yes gene_type:complete